MIRPELFHTQLLGFFSGISQAIHPDIMKRNFINFVLVEFMNKILRNQVLFKTLCLNTSLSDEPPIRVSGFEFVKGTTDCRLPIRILVDNSDLDRDVVGNLNFNFGDITFDVKSTFNTTKQRGDITRLHLSHQDAVKMTVVLGMAFREITNFMVKMEPSFSRPERKDIMSGEQMFIANRGNPIDAAVVVNYQYQCNEEGNDTSVYSFVRGKNIDVYSGTLLTFEEFMNSMGPSESSYVNPNPVSEEETEILKRFVDVMSSKEQ